MSSAQLSRRAIAAGVALVPAPPRAMPRGDARQTAAIIRAAVIYAQAEAAWHAGVKIDPDGNKETAADLGCRYTTMAEGALKKLARVPASSAEALDAKARVFALTLDDDDFYMSDAKGKFYTSFAADVRTFLKAAVYEEWGARKAAARQSA